jgi:LemA protein
MIASAAATAVAGAIVLAAALALWTGLAFNRLVRERNLMREGWSGIDVQLKRRRNLVPNLVETVKAYGRHERELLTGVAEIRADGAGAEGVKEMEGRENVLTDQLKHLFALAEAYPDLKADRNYLTLQKQLADIEDQIQMARRYYNGAVRNYNIRVESFPSNLVARLFGFRLAEFFEIETATERAAPKVEMSE